jgi:hypothetical protein
MAWRPTEHLVSGELDNTVPGKVTGTMIFRGLDSPVTFDLDGNFHRDIRGAKIRLAPRHPSTPDEAESREYMSGFKLVQTGDVGDMTAGRPPYDYVRYPYIEWYGAENGRVVIELEPDEVELVSSPIPACESFPIDRDVQEQHMTRFLQGIVNSFGS